MVNNLLCQLRFVWISAEKQHANRVLFAEFPMLLFCDQAQIRVRFLQQQTTAITSFTIGGDTATVSHAIKC
ncbi:Uncharacterised protein [Vibrio cholerae]|nr:Uncharacterised protein [Vibrio cholerae]CSD11103.1 Uncharacterised protein [Vibrio cholerae]